MLLQCYTGENEVSVNSPLSIERHCGGVGSGCSSSTTRRSRFERAPCDNDVDDDHDPVLLLLLLQTTIQKKLKETPFLSFCLFSLKFSPSSLPRIAFFFSLSLFLFLQSPWPIEKRRLDDAGSRRSCARLARLFMAGGPRAFASPCFALPPLIPYCQQQQQWKIRRKLRFVIGFLPMLHAACAAARSKRRAPLVNREEANLLLPKRCSVAAETIIVASFTFLVLFWCLFLFFFSFFWHLLTKQMQPTNKSTPVKCLKRT